jgi:hypothetical protein
MAYSDVDEVKRLLRILEPATNNQFKIRLSNSHTIPEVYSTNTGTCVLKKITTIKTDYVGSELWHITFSSPTAFTLYRGDGLNVPDGTGVIGSSFTSTSTVITIAAAEWAGTPVATDQIKFRTDSNISEDDADSFIEDADEIINGLLSEFLDSTNVPFTSTIPTGIIKASTYYAANLIFTSVYATMNTDEVPQIVRGWANFARNLVNMYIESIAGKEIRKYSRYARFASRKPLFDKVGVQEAAGVEGMGGVTDAVNVTYDEDNNSKEAIGST